MLPKAVPAPFAAAAPAPSTDQTHAEQMAALEASHRAADAKLERELTRLQDAIGAAHDEMRATKRQAEQAHDDRRARISRELCADVRSTIDPIFAGKLTDDAAATLIVAWRALNDRCVRLLGAPLDERHLLFACERACTGRAPRMVYSTHAVSSVTSAHELAAQLTSAAPIDLAVCDLMRATMINVRRELGGLFNTDEHAAMASTNDATAHLRAKRVEAARVAANVARLQARTSDLQPPRYGFDDDGPHAA